MFGARQRAPSAKREHRGPLEGVEDFDLKAKARFAAGLGLFAGTELGLFLSQQTSQKWGWRIRCFGGVLRPYQLYPKKIFGTFSKQVLNIDSKKCSSPVWVKPASSRNIGLFGMLSSRGGPVTTRWTTTLSSKFNLHDAINFRAIRGANLVTRWSRSPQNRGE